MSTPREKMIDAVVGHNIRYRVNASKAVLICRTLYCRIEDLIQIGDDQEATFASANKPVVGRALEIK